MRWIVIACLLCAPVFAKDKAEGRIGDLLITATGVEETANPKKPGFHNTRVKITVKNVGKSAVCASLKSSLDSTLNTQTKGSIEFKDKTKATGGWLVSYINQLLPGEAIEGEIGFTDIRDGIRPVKLQLEPGRDSNQGCGTQRSIPGYRHEVTIKLAEVPSL